MTDFEQIKTECLQRGQLWEDPEFTADETSLFYHQTPPFEFIWKRPKEIYNNPTFVLEDYNTFDVRPGKLGDKWLVSCFGVLYLNKGLFHRVVPKDQGMDSAYAGIFRFKLWWCGQWLEVVVDDRLPTINGKLAFVHTTHTGQLWPALLEKAYAKMHGSYEALKYGSLLDALGDFTGGIRESIPVSEIAAPELQSLLKSSSVVTAHHFRDVTAINVNRVVMLEIQMNYRVYKIEKVNTNDCPVFLVRLRRPLAPGEAKVTNLVDPKIWNSISLYERERIDSKTDGIWMLYSDFQKKFSHLEIVHLDAETSRVEPSLAEKHKWQMKMHQGGWRRGVSAGGCKNHSHYFHINPQIQLLLNESDTVIIALNQHSIMEPKVIGFSIYKLPKFLTEAAAPGSFKRIKNTINSEYTNSRQVSLRVQLDMGAYLVIPTTFEPREEANFTLRFFSNKPLEMMVLDYTPQMLKAALIKAPPGVVAPEGIFSQYETLFMQLADEHGTIHAFDLQELLDACLPNDYIKSCASIDTCKQIVLTMDKNEAGRMSLSDFKDLICSLKHWQCVFKSHAVEKMGVLRAERLRSALQEVGFVVPERALALLVLRYMRQDGMLRFGDFVSAVMHLHRAFSVFYNNDSQRFEMLNLNLSEWLMSSLMC